MPRKSSSMKRPNGRQRAGPAVAANGAVGSVGLAMTVVSPRRRQASFVRLRRVALKLVDHPGLGGPERQPIVPELLQRHEELLAALQRLLAEFVMPLELGLEG